MGAERKQQNVQQYHNGIDKEIMPIEDKMPLINVGQPVARIELGYGQALSVYQILKMQHGNEYGIAPFPISSESFLKMPGTQKLYKRRPEIYQRLWLQTRLLQPEQLSPRRK